MAVQGHFIGDYTLHEPDQGDGVDPDDFLLNPDRTVGFGFVDELGKVLVTVTEPFITDGATTPWFLQIFRWLRRYGMIRRAAFCHDWMWVRYHLGDRTYTFRQTNAIFYGACRACGLTAFSAYVCWLAITLFGWHMWVGKGRRQAQAHACVNLAGTIMRRKGIVR